MRLGLNVSEDSADALTQASRSAARAGFDSLWFGNVFGFDAMTACVGAALGAEKITVGTFVVPTFSRHPLYLAQQAISTQALAGGRFVLGIGTSHRVVVERYLGLSFDRPLRHMREYLSVLVPLLDDGVVDFQGETLRVSNRDVPLSRLGAVRPPVIVAALGAEMLKLAGSLADGTATWMTGPVTLASHIVPTLHRAASSAGRPSPRTIAGVPVCVTDDVDGARERCAERYGIYGRLPSYRAMLEREQASGPADVAVIGDEAHLAETMRRYADAGVDDFVAAPFGTSDEVLRTTELLGELS
jgi:F420-dependent oxidoreductase-like protein